MKKTIALLLTVLTASFLQLNAQSAAPVSTAPSASTPAHMHASSHVKIGIISIQELIVSMPEALKADSILRNFQNDLQNTYLDMVKEYQAKDSTLRVDSAKWSNTTKELKKNDLLRLTQQIQGFQQSVEDNLQKKQQELLTPIRIQAQEAIQKYAAKNGYTHVIEKGVLYYSPLGDDLLDKVQKELGIKNPPAAGASMPRAKK